MDSRRRGNCLQATAKDEWAMDNAKIKWKRRAVQKLTLAACVASGCLFGGATAKAQGAARTQGAASNSRLLTVEEGRAIPDPARDQDRPRHSPLGGSDLDHHA